MWLSFFEVDSETPIISNGQHTNLTKKKLTTNFRYDMLFNMRRLKVMTSDKYMDAHRERHIGPNQRDSA